MDHFLLTVAGSKQDILLANFCQKLSFVITLIKQFVNIFTHWHLLTHQLIGKKYLVQYFLSCSPSLEHFNLFQQSAPTFILLLPSLLFNSPILTCAETGRAMSLCCFQHKVQVLSGSARERGITSPQGEPLQT